MSVLKFIESDGVVAYRASYAKLQDSDAVCALFLSQVVYWCSRSDDSVAWITHESLLEQTGLTRKMQDRAAKYWESLGVLTKFVKGMPPVIHYHVDFDLLESLITSAICLKGTCPKGTPPDVQKVQQVGAQRDRTVYRDYIETTETTAHEESEEQARPIHSQLVASVASDSSDSLPLLEAEQESGSNRPDGTVTGKKRMSPKENLSAEPCEADWVAYCTERYPDWPEARVRALWAYHGSRGWMIGRQKMKNWKLVAATGYSKAKEFGHLVVVKSVQTSRVAKLGYEED